MSTLVWFKRDLRVGDHPALLRALDLGDPVPVYILEPEYWQLPDTSGRQYGFLCETLDGLRNELRALGSDLVIRVGAAVQVLQQLQRETGAQVMISHEETGNAWTYARDRQVAAWARAEGLAWEELPQCAVRRGRHDRDAWGAHRHGWMRQEALAAPQALPPVPPLASDALPTLRDLSLQDDCPDRQPGGGQRAQGCLHSFLHQRGAQYRQQMSSPVTAPQACSRLSPHIALGALSPREVAQRTAQVQREATGPWRPSLKSFQSRLAWRDHFIQKLEDEPELEWRCLHRLHEGLRPDVPDQTRLEAWQKGETGVPFVDACMRYLNAGGWINFRMRAMLMSFASYHLWLPWQVTGQHLARQFTDYEPGIHWSQCQMQSGTTGINTLRIYNPVKQGLEQDPEGQFTRRWCPELGHLNGKALHSPWTQGEVRGYPAPLVDVAQAGRAARDAVWSLRREAGFGAEAQKVVRKHASRKDRQGHFVNDRARKPRGKPKDDRQMSFDL